MIKNKKKLFVSNLDFEVTEAQLRELFETVGEPHSVVLATDRETKKSRGFGFVEMDSEDEALACIEQLNSKELNGRPIRVCEDRGKAGDRIEGGSHAAGGAPGADGERRREFLPPIQRMMLFRRKKKSDPFEEESKKVDYRDVNTLRRFVSERGKILSRRYTGLSAYNQRRVTKSIKRAQSLGLLPYES
jgi:small subunit ribosomal protein S18